MIKFLSGLRGKGVGERGERRDKGEITFIVFWSELSQGLGVGECLLRPAGGDEGDEFELVEVELEAAAVAMKLSSVVLCPPTKLIHVPQVTNIWCDKCVESNCICIKDHF